MNKNLEAQDEIDTGIDLLEIIIMAAVQIEEPAHVGAIQRAALVAQEKLNHAIELLKADIEASRV